MSRNMRKMAVFACAVSCMSTGKAAENVQATETSASKVNIVNIVARINPLHQAGGVEHDAAHGRNLHVRRKVNPPHDLPRKRRQALFTILDCGRRQPSD